MSMSALVEAVRNHLREQMSLTCAECDIAPDGHPPGNAGSEFIAVDEGEATNAARENLQEEYEINVWVCRKSGVFPANKRGDMRLKSEPYLAGMVSLDERCRQVIVALHANHAVTKAASELLSAPNTELGSPFQGCLIYRSTSRAVSIDSESGGAWVARQLRFRGAWRPHSLSYMG